MGRKLVPHGDADAAAHPEPGEDAFGNLPDESGCPVVRIVDLERGAVLYLEKYCRIFKSDADPAIHPAGTRHACQAGSREDGTGSGQSPGDRQGTGLYGNCSSIKISGSPPWMIWYWRLSKGSFL